MRRKLAFSAPGASQGIWRAVLLPDNPQRVLFGSPLSRHYRERQETLPNGGDTVSGNCFFGAGWPGRGQILPRTSRASSELQLQPELQHTRASRTDQVVAGGDVGSAARGAERPGHRGVNPVEPSRRSSVRIGEQRVIEHIEDLDPDLGTEPLPECKVLEYREIPVSEAQVAEEVPAHGAERSGQRGSHNGFAVDGHVATTGRQRFGVAGIGRAQRPERCGEVHGVELAGLCASNTAGCRLSRGIHTEAAAVRNGQRTRFKVAGVPEEIPAVSALSRPAEIKPGVGNEPGLASLKVDDGVNLPAFQ